MSRSKDSDGLLPSVPHLPLGTDQYDLEEEETYTRKSGAAIPKPLGVFLRAYFGVSAMLGFRNKLSLSFFILFGGALIGFCLSGVRMMIPSNLETKTVPGEWYWYRQPFFKYNLLAHIYLNIIAGILAVFQFIPKIRQRKIIFHRVNGYLVLVMLLPAVVSGSMVARRSFGGELNSQVAFYTVGSIAGFAAYMGISNVRETPKHRKWMLRMVVYTSCPATARVIAIVTGAILTISAPHYAVWTCDEVAFLLNSASTAASKFPACALSLGDDPKSVSVLVHASISKDPINTGSTQRVSYGMALWLALVIHAIAVETYIRATEPRQ